MASHPPSRSPARSPVRSLGLSAHRLQVEALRADRELALRSLRSAFMTLDDPAHPGAALSALRDAVDACGGVSVVAAQAGMRREVLNHVLSAHGNPTLKTLLAVLKAVGLRLSVEFAAD